jgi:electron transport complex protein RnfC
VWDIHGGIHPEENKQQSNQQPISAAGIPEFLILPLSQHIGAPAEPIVNIGDHVLKGQCIATAKGFVSVPVHASSSGEVIAIEDRIIAHPSGMSAPCIVIKTDQQDQWIEHSGIEDYSSLEKKTLLNLIREAGIAGMGGAGFPAAVKLGVRDDQPIETLIINGTECEPYITSDDMLMRERAEQIIEGTKLLRHLINPSEATLIGVEDNKPEAIAALQKAAQGSGIEIVSFPTKYPSGGEKQLIQILTGKEVPAGGLPAQVGIVCQNVGSVVAIYRAITFGEPLISRITTITGEACEQQKNLEVLLGTPIEYLLQLCGFNAKNCSRLIMGGPMMGFTLESTEVPVVKTTNCILAPTAKEIAPPTPAQACIRCGLCAEACPASLLPQQLYWFARGKEYEKLEEHNLKDCIECGACSFVCPSNIPLVQYYRASKADIRQRDLEAKNAEHSKIRFEARQARIERLEAEKIAKREARKAAAQAKAAGASDDKTAKVDAVQAAIERAKAKRAGNTDDKPSQASLEQALASVEKRLASAKEKLEQARQQNSDKLAAFETGVEKTEAKYQQAKQALEQFIAANPVKDTSATDSSDTSSDAAQQAIARAQQKRATTTEISPQEKAQQAVSALQKRIEKAQQKLELAKAENSDKLAIFEDSVNGLKDKLTAAEQELAKFASSEETSAVKNQLKTAKQPEANDDVVQDVIAQAIAKRAALSSMTDQERLQNAVDSITKRIEKAQERLAKAQAEGSDNTEILAESIIKLTTKLSDAKAALAEKA